MTEIKFGTDGWRGKIADDYTFETLRRCTQGFANYILEDFSPEQVKRGIVIGGDRRFHSDNFAIVAAEVLAGNGIPVHFCGAGIPTPVISFSVKLRKAIGAINITASHNPPTDNGFKVRDEHGGAIPPENLKKIERLIPVTVDLAKRVTFEKGVTDGLIMKFDPIPGYIDQLRTLVDFEAIKQAGFTVLVDPMWGNGAGWFQNLIGGGKTKIVEVHSERNPCFPEMLRPEPIHPNIDAGLAKAKEIKADVVVITDGDADRCGLGDENGNFIDQLRVYALLAMYLLDTRKLKGGIVKTLSTTSMLEALGKLYDVPVYETGVGFKYVAPKMMETDALIGGEESGGYAFRGHVPERDGILAGLYFLDMMCKTGLKPSQLLAKLFEKVGEHFYDRIDITIDAKQKDAILKRVQTTVPASIARKKVLNRLTEDGFKYMLEDGSWLLIRFSGTEPLVRIYSEALSKADVKNILNDGDKLVRG